MHSVSSICPFSLEQTIELKKMNHKFYVVTVSKLSTNMILAWGCCMKLLYIGQQMPKLQNDASKDGISPCGVDLFSWRSTPFGFCGCLTKDTCLYIYIHIHMDIYIYIYIYVWYKYKYIYTHIYIYPYVYIYIYIYIYISICIYIYIHM